MGSDVFILIPVFFLIAIVYSSVGFGGGSSYLAVLALFPLDYAVIKSTALICNIIVVSGGTYLFYKKGYLKFNKIWPLILLSVPFAYLGGSWKLEEHIFFIILGITLLVASILMLIPKKKQGIETEHNHPISNGFIGSGIGFLSGIVGIGGGIFLAPFLHLTYWDKPKVIAATASLFILANSISGIIGQSSIQGFSINWSVVIYLILAVFIGGQIGSRLTLKFLKPLIVKRLTAILIAIVSIRILVKYTL